MYEPIFELASFGTLPLDDRKHLIEVMCEALIAVNRTWLKRNPNAPSFYSLAPKYALKLRPFGIDRWQDFPQTIALKEGDCKDFVCIRVAELREAGCPDCGPRILASEAKGVISYHVQVRIDTKIEDPSVAMGMPKNLSADQLKALFTDPNTGLPGSSTPDASATAGCSCTPAQLQQMLGYLGARPPVQVTGVFDKQTSDAVASFQKYSGMNPTGYPDPHTVSALHSVIRSLGRRAA